MALALVSNLDEGVAGHVLNTLVCLVHEFEQLVDHGLQELPVRLQESRVLAHNVHDIAGHHCFVVLASLHLSQAQKIFDHGNQRSASQSLLT